jgi:tRNA threonylcarbamoyladenosine biosynthesis protein TsaB
MFLSIDTCGATGTVALARLADDKIALLAQAELPGKTYSARLVSTIRDLLAANDLQLAALEAIVVTTGPGSFTGIRIGLSTAKGLAEPTAIPILAVSRLAVLAHKARGSNTATRAAALDASRGELYFGSYSTPIPTESLLTRDQFLAPASALGSQLAVSEPTLLLIAPTAALVAPPTAADALHYALPRLQARDFDDPLLLDGNYIRRSDAEIFSAPGAPPRTRPASRA